MCIRVIGAPIVREPDGLALSSRNTYLSPNDRARALSISHSLKSQQQVWDGNLDVSTLTNTIRQLLRSMGDYVNLWIQIRYYPSIAANTRLLAALWGNQINTLRSPWRSLYDKYRFGLYGFSRDYWPQSICDTNTTVENSNVVVLDHSTFHVSFGSWLICGNPRFC